MCGAFRTGGAPLSGGVGDMGLLILVAGAMLFSRRRRTARQLR
jgi:MYXO-CTERM domain-containing protein